MSFVKPKGTYDVLSDKSKVWNFVEGLVREECAKFNFGEIRTPMFEASELYHRSAGETSDVVSKETYDFLDRADRKMTLRPEGTAGVVRSFIENKLYVSPAVQKFFYVGPMFRYERQQKGRYRQHVQFGVEAFRSNSPLLDVEVISLACRILARLGLDSNVKVKLNSLGSSESRARYRDALVSYFEGCRDELCSDCQVRFEKNPLRILDCKKDSGTTALKNVPKIIDYLIDEDLSYFNEVRAGLDAVGIAYEYDGNLVRGFDYYTHTIFEVQADIPGFGAQSTLCGGGRYNGLVEELGGPSTPAVGFGMGLERVLLALEAAGIDVVGDSGLDCFFIPLGSEAKNFTVKLMNEVRADGVSCDTDFSDKKLKAKFKLADDSGAKYVVVLGDDEIATGVIQVKELASGESREVKLELLAEVLRG